MSTTQYGFQLNYTPVNTISGVTASGFFDFSPLLDNDSGLIFDTSDFNAIFNNYNLNRPNTFLQDVDYSTDAITPVNIGLIRNNAAIKANTPDSNYTARRVIYPRYEGSRLSSVDYNFYTPPASTQSFLNGDTGSWSGDISFGNASVIDSHPIYFAHFRESIENFELFGSYTFKIDALIQCPLEDIGGTENATSLPPIIKLNGGSDNIYETVNTFSPGRKAIVSYQNTIKDGINYSLLTPGGRTILNGGEELQVINSSENTQFEYLVSQSYTTASYHTLYNNSKTPATLPPSTSPTNDISLSTPANAAQDNFPFWMITGSTVTTNTGEIFLRGGLAILSQSFGDVNALFPASSSYNGYLLGPSLGLFQSVNKAIDLGLQCDLTDIDNNNYLTPGYPSGSFFTADDISNYLIFNVSSSLTGSYEDFRQPFLIKPGDELRITYDYLSGSGQPPSYITQDFQVISNPGVDPPTVGGNPVLSGKVDFPTTPTLTTTITGSYYGKLIVSPDPQTLKFPIPRGHIYSFTVRRLTETDNKVILFQTPPIGSDGANTPSGEGYLIPNDFSDQQKRNALTLISQLKNANVFRDDTNIG